jgi:hypothetical protein
VKSFSTLYNVSVSPKDAALTSITFDGRGFAVPRLSSTGIFRINGANKKDSLCITTAGQLMPRGCSL